MKFGEYEKAEEEWGVGNRGGGWMRLQDGDNRIRIVSEFEDYGEHWSGAHNQSFVCVGKDKCVFCKQNREAEEKGEDAPSPLRVRYLGWVIDREDDEVKLLRIGHSIFKQIGKFAVDEEYEFSVTPNYDITIKKSGTGLDTEYSVLPGREVRELTEEEKERVEQAASADPREIIDRMKSKLFDRMRDEWGIDIYDDGEEVEEYDVEDLPF